MFCAERSGSRGSRTTEWPPSTLEASTPLFAQTKPCGVSVIVTPCPRLTMRSLSSSAVCVMRGSSLNFSAHCCALRDGRMDSSGTIRPSALETILWVMTSTSPSSSFLRLVAASTSAAMSSPGRTSPMPSMGMARSSGMRGARVLPVEKKLLGARANRFAQECVEIIGTINIQSDAGEVANDDLESGGAGGGEMRLEAVVSKFQRDEIERAAQDGVGAAIVGGRHDDAAAIGHEVEDGANFVRGDQRNVGGEDDGEIGALAAAEGGRHFDGGSFAGLIGVDNDGELAHLCLLRSPRIATDDRNAGVGGERREGIEDVFYHGASECAAFFRGQRR